MLGMELAARCKSLGEGVQAMWVGTLIGSSMRLCGLGAETRAGPACLYAPLYWRCQRNHRMMKNPQIAHRRL
jgi:hypothetical protein